MPFVWALPSNVMRDAGFSIVRAQDHSLQWSTEPACDISDSQVTHDDDLCVVQIWKLLSRASFCSSDEVLRRRCPLSCTCCDYFVIDAASLCRSSSQRFSTGKFAAIILTAVGFEPTPLRTGALSQRLRPLGQTVLSVTPKVFQISGWAQHALKCNLRLSGCTYSLH